MTSTTLDKRFERELSKFSSESDSTSAPQRTPGTETGLRSARRSEIRRLSPIARRSLTRGAPPKPCCDGACGMADPRAVMAAIVRGAQEVINGARPLNILTRWLTSDAYEALAKRVSIQARSSRPTRRTVTITSSHACRIGHDIAEGTVILSDGGRIRAAVIRLEAHRGRWRASFLQTV